MAVDSFSVAIIASFRNVNSFHIAMVSKTERCHLILIVL